MSAESFAPGLQAEYRVANAPLQDYPYPHFYLRDVFPQDFYAELQRNLPDTEALARLGQWGRSQGYPERSIMKLGGERPAALSEAQHQFWRRIAQWAFSGRLGSLILGKFNAIVEQRLKDMPGVEITDELLLVHDRTHYSLGPHTDSPTKVISLLFYLPADDRLAQYGTSIYIPKDPAFTCRGGPHHGFEGFERIATMPFLPNSLFGFVKTDRSFHGVEPFEASGAGRWLLLYDLRLRAIAADEPPPAAAGPRVQFKS